MINFKTVTKDDIDRISNFRMILLKNTKSHYGSNDNKLLSDIKNSFKLWMEKNLNSDEVHFVMSENENNEVVSIGIGIIDTRAPIIGALNGKSGWISSLIVNPDYRNHGVGKVTLNHLLKWFYSNEISKIVLHSTEEGETLYEKSGFIKDNEQIFIKNILK
ncbi:GNAT family N-acetyltransferase [Staphylococcus felis]|uniref:GCN5-related N-acetyltransferase n=1 Tax=Staphylococcus felis TaxID=46127 RepID=A0ABS0QMQ2_9STAP|nr:GNAT family N-acetyltransferase [Staphylococcus felis]MBH9580494.1 GNAT family N-acetyltransferase [Staphylococcus felis]